MAPAVPISRLPPTLAGSTSVLVSQIPLPPIPFISYAKYVTVGDLQQQQQHKTIELARQRIVNSVRQTSKCLVDSLLPVVCIGKEESALWVFAIGSGVDSHDTPGRGKGKEKAGLTSPEELEAFGFVGLRRCQFSRFTPSTLYPCSPECATLQEPCDSCSNATDVSAARPSVSSPATILPRASLRPIYSLFLNAVRDRLIDDVCAVSVRAPELQVGMADPQKSRRMLRATRLGNGFLSIEDNNSPAWGSGWEHRSRNRPLVHTAFRVCLTSAIHIRPLPTLTTLFPLPAYQFEASLQPTSPTLGQCPSGFPLTPGSPLILAPYQTPAFYLSTHLGSSIPGPLLAQFWDALTGLGAYSIPLLSRGSSPRSSSSPPKARSQFHHRFANIMRENFILVFVPLTNLQGEPKVITALWPVHLVFVDTSPSRSHLTDIPEIPGTEALLTPPSLSGSQSASQPPQTAVTTSQVHSLGCKPLYLASRSQRAFRVIELSSHKRLPGEPVPETAKQTAGFVENVAREREKERERANQERVKRERDLKEGKSLAPGPSTPSTITTDATQTSQAIHTAPTTVPPPSKASAGLNRATNSLSTMSSFFVKAAHGIEVNSFYPSPPDWDPITSSSGPSTSEVPSLVSIAPARSSSSAGVNNTLSNAQSQPASNVPPQTISGSLDLGSGISLGMDMDMTMDMGINLHETIGFDMTVDMDARGIMEGTFGSFTDDDFNYFDTAPAGIPLSAPHLPNSLHDLDAGEGAVDEWLRSGLQQGKTGASQQLQCTTDVLQPGTPKSVEVVVVGHVPTTPHRMDSVHVSEDDGDLLLSAPGLISSSPAKSPWSPGNPPTPTLVLNVTPTLAGGKGTFEPIVFGKSHWLADGKYIDAFGKFSFPDQAPHFPCSTFAPDCLTHLNSDKDDGWKLRYDAVTDPRVGMINRLRGVKRKLLQETQYDRVVRKQARDEEWADLYYQNEDADLSESSSSESDEEIEEPERGQDHDDTSCDSPFHPTTPPPAGLPLTATLLYAHFHHTHLLPLGIPMRTSYGVLVSPTDPSPLPISVPTPVSPAAALGSATERDKILELLAQAIAKEAVDNDVWAEAWAISPDIPSDKEFGTLDRSVSQTDLRRISQLLEKVDGLRATTKLSDLLEPEKTDSVNKLHLMRPPRFSIGRAGLVHHMFPTATRFWEKEGLGPRAGTKNVVAFALFEGGEERSSMVDRWLGRVSRAYNARRLGAHVAGTAGDFERGLVPVQFETVRKTLSNLMLALPSEPPHIVLYIIAPPSVSFSLKSPVLRTLILSRKHIPKLPGQHDFDQDRVLVHFVPDYLVADPHTYPTTRYVGLERFVTSVYDRLLRPTLRQTSRQLWECNPPFEHRFQAPAYVLARESSLQTHLEWTEWPSLNVLDRHTFLQVGYRVSPCGKWLVAACIDERGEAYDVAVWGVPEASARNVNWVVSNVWIFARQFAQRADTEWRIVVAKLGEMGKHEVEEWMSHLETLASAQPGPPVHVSLVCAQNDIPLSFLSCTDTARNGTASIPTNSNSVFMDVSSTTYSAFLPQRLPTISPDSFCPANHASVVAPVAAEEDSDQLSPKSLVGVLPMSTTVLLRVPNETDLTTISNLYIHLLHVYKSVKSTLKRTTHEVHADITRNWYELAVLTRERWHFARHEDLPFHLGALHVMSDVLKPLTSAPDMVMKDAEFLEG